MAKKAYTEQKSGKKAWITAVVIIAALLIIGLAVFNNLNGKGIILRSKTAASTDNYEVSGTMMAYAAGSTYQNFAKQLESYGVDMTKSLKEQFLPGTEEENAMSWFDYIIEYSKSSIDQILSLCEYAKTKGIELDDNDKAVIKADLDSLAESAKAQYSYPTLDSFLKAAYGNGINVKDAEKFNELYALANKASAAFYDDALPTEEEREAYYAEHPEEFDGVDFYTYSVELPKSETEETEDGEETVEIDVDKAGETKDALAAIAFAQALSEVKDVDEFKSMIRDYEATLDPEATEEDLDSIVNNTFVKHVVKTAVSDEDIAAWLFDEAKVGDVKLFTEA